MKPLGPSSIPAYVAYELSQPVSHLIKECLKTNCFPHQFKLANINPLHKKGCTEDPLNYQTNINYSGQVKSF